MQGPGNPEAPGTTTAAVDVDASRRTYLANERTQLAWWRTGLTSVAVALAVGKVVPELGDTTTRWPYVAVGVGFALYGVAMIAYGSWRSRAIDTSLRTGHYPAAPDHLLSFLAAVGVGLSVLTAVLVVVD